LVHASKAIDKEACKLHGINVSSLTTGVIVGSAVLCDVKLYQSKEEFIADQSKHLATSTYSANKTDSYSLILKDLISQLL
jgi:hypothetical protein